MDNHLCFWNEPGIRLGDVNNWRVELLPLVVSIADHSTGQQQAGTGIDFIKWLQL